MRSRYRCSMCPAIHINSRSWLRSSSTREPSDPPLRVVSPLVSLLSPPIAEAGRDDGGCSGAKRRLVARRTVRRRKKDNRVGRPKYRRRLFEPSQCRRRRPTWRTPPPPARSSRHRERDRDRYPTLLRVFTDRVRLAASGFHAERRPSSPPPPPNARRRPNGSSSQSVQ